MSERTYTESDLAAERAALLRKALRIALWYRHGPINGVDLESAILAIPTDQSALARHDEELKAQLTQAHTRIAMVIDVMDKYGRGSPSIRTTEDNVAELLDKVLAVDLRESIENGELKTALARVEEAARDPFRKLLEGLDPFNGGRDGDECLWCRRSRPRDLTSWQETRNPDYHDLDCEFVAAILALQDRGREAEK